MTKYIYIYLYGVTHRKSDIPSLLGTRELDRKRKEIGGGGPHSLNLQASRREVDTTHVSLASNTRVYLSCKQAI